MAISGQKNVSSAGTAVQLGQQAINGGLLVKALDSNSGVVALGNDGSGDVSLSSGLRLQAGEVVVFAFVGDLASLWLDAANNGEGVCWLALNV